MGRRLWLLGVLLALGGCAAPALGGCAAPAGIDRALTDDWSTFPAPNGFVPPGTACHAAGFAEVGYRSAYEQVDCTAEHRTETVAVGTYSGAAAAGAAAPERGTPEGQAAYADCSRAVTTFTGGPWHTARLWLGVVNPSAAAWQGGARWYRCDVVEVSSVEDDGDVVLRTGSVRDALAKPGAPLLLTCYGVLVNRAGAIDSMPAKPCDQPHNAQFAGVWTAPTDAGYPRADADWARFHVGCRGVIAEFVRVPNDKNLEFRTGVVSLPGGEDVWAAGDRAVRCYLWVAGASFTGSVQGKGEQALPIQYE